MRDLTKDIPNQAWRKDYLFGGRVFIFSGDWRQILPVIKRGTRAQVVNATLKRSHLWPSINQLFLLGNMRIDRLILQGSDRQLLIERRL